ncbi:hypothetical protein KAI68_07855 [bacterium]|nr:hypothetical protein [bacterium]
MNCYCHQEVSSVGECVGCGNFICADCKVEIEGRVYCKKCSNDLTMALRKRKEQTNLNISEEEIKEGKIWAIAGYLGILCLLPLLIKKDNQFALFHGKQGLVLFLFIIVAGWIPIFGWFIISPLVFIMSIIGIIKALMGKCFELPVIGKIAEKIKM